MAGTRAELTVLVTIPLPEAQRAAIQAVSSQIRLLYAPRRVDWEALLPQTDVVYGLHFSPDLACPPRLRWLQLYSAGIDHLVGTKIGEEVPTVTTVSGIHGVPMAEHVFGGLLILVRRFHLTLRQQFERRQIVKREELFTVGELYGKTMGILGLGSIGRALARYARCFGMRVLATRRSYEPEMADSPKGEEAAVDRMFPPSQLAELLKESDAVVISLPFTPQTTKLIGERELRAMKPTAYLVNIARGKIVDEVALLRALREGWIAGAVLDVVEEEPLRLANPLFELPNVVLTPHIAGASERYDERATALFCENLRRYLAGEPLRNVADRQRGY